MQIGTDEIEAAARALRAAKRTSLPYMRLASAIERLVPLLGSQPRLALLGEFGTGKSLLASVLVRSRRPLAGPEKNPAGSILVHGNGAGNPAAQEAVPVRRAYLEIPAAAPILAHVQILDLPGLFDPARGSESPSALAQDAQIAVWCTPATQAWKASDVEAWFALPQKLREMSVLAVTCMDALESPEDGARVMRRLVREAGGLFRHIVPVSARLAARALGDNGDIVSARSWQDSGLPVLEEKLLELAGEHRRAVEKRGGAILAKLTRAALGKGDTGLHRETAERMVRDWRRVIDDLADPVERGEKPPGKAVEEFVALAGHVARDVIQPWLRENFDPEPGAPPPGNAVFKPLPGTEPPPEHEPFVFPPLRFNTTGGDEPMVFPPVPPGTPLPSARVLALIDFDRPRLMALLGECPPAEAAQVLRAVGAQIAAEIGECVASLPPRTNREVAGLDPATLAVLHRLRDGTWFA